MISNSILSSALNLDIIAFIKPWELGLIEFDEDGETAALELFSNQVKDLGYDSPNFLKNMSTYSIFLCYYWCKSVLLLIFYIMGVVFKRKWIKRKVKA